LVTTLLLISLVLAAAALGCIVVIAARRAAVSIMLARRQRLEMELRRVILQFLNGGPPPARLSRAQFKTAVEILRRYAGQLDGEALERAAKYFEGHGALGEELKAMRSHTGWRRARAAYRLGDMTSDATPELLAGLEDPSRDVRSAAARSAGRIGIVEAAERIARLLAANEIPRVQAAESLIALGPPALPPLHDLLHDEHSEVRATAAQMIGLVGGPADMPAILHCLRDGAAEVRAKACGALARIGGADCAPELRARLSDRIPFVRVRAAAALGAIGDRDALSLLTTQARDDVFDPAAAAARALTAIDSSAVVTAAREPDPGQHLTWQAELVNAGLA
jgi:HEAT repeat protein